MTLFMLPYSETCLLAHIKELGTPSRQTTVLSSLTHPEILTLAVQLPEFLRYPPGPVIFRRHLRHVPDNPRRYLQVRVAMSSQRIWNIGYMAVWNSEPVKACSLLHKLLLCILHRYYIEH
jgi:hypothetical protein